MKDACEVPAYADPVLGQVRTWKAEGRKHPACDSLPRQDIVCTTCPKAMWMWVEKTDPAKKNAMPGFEVKVGWRCHCREMNRVTYDEYSSQSDPDGWVFGCTARAEALQRYEDEARKAAAARG